MGEKRRGNRRKDDDRKPDSEDPVARPEGQAALSREGRTAEGRNRLNPKDMWKGRNSLPVPGRWSQEEKERGEGRQGQEHDQGRAQNRERDGEGDPDPRHQQHRGPGLGARSWDPEERDRARGPRDAGMSHDGQRLGYGASHHTFRRVDASASQGANLGSVGGNVYQTYFGTGGGLPPVTGHYTGRDLDLVASRYTATGTEKQVGRLLKAEHVAVLRARSRSGRRTTALYCLDRELRGALADEPRRIDILSPGEEPESVRAQTENPDHGPCFLLDATGASWPRTLTESAFQAAFGGFASSGRRLIILIDEPAPAERLHGLIVDHQVPPPREQVLAHLTDLCRRRRPEPAAHASTVLESAEDASDGLVASWIHTMWCPAEAALLTAALDLWDQQEVPSLAKEVGERRRSWLDQHARELMASAVAERAPWDQAYVLAGAVLDGLPSAGISHAAELLVRVLRTGADKEAGGPGGTAHHFSEPVERRLRHMRTVDLEDGGTGLALPQPELGPALLHVTWHDHPRVQRSLVAWLALLCEHPESEPGVIAATAQSLAQLAGYAPDLVLDRTVRRWGAEGENSSARCTWAAAWLLEKLVFNQAPTPEALDDVSWTDPRRRIVAKVAVLLREWASTDRLKAALPTGSWDVLTRWMIAMVTYGTYASLVPPIREGATTALEEAAQLSVQTRRLALVSDDARLGASLTELADNYASFLQITATDAYRAGLRGPVVRELARWSREPSPDLLLVACNTMLGIAGVRSDESWNAGAAGPVRPVDGDDRPYDLLLWLSTGGDGLSGSDREQVRKLWVVALGHPGTEREAWRRLFEWDLQVGSPITAGQADYVGYSGGSPISVPPMRDYLTEIFAEIYGRSELAPLQQRLDHYYRLRERIAPDEFPTPQGGPR